MHILVIILIHVFKRHDISLYIHIDVINSKYMHILVITSKHAFKLHNTCLTMHKRQTVSS